MELEIDRDNAINLYQQGTLKIEDISKITGITKDKLVEILKEEDIYKSKKIYTYKRVF